MQWVNNHEVQIRTRFTKKAQEKRERKKEGYYQDSSKADDVIKQMFNRNIGVFTQDLQKYYREILGENQQAREVNRNMQFLVLDSIFLGTTTKLVTVSGINTSQIDICSREVEFCGPGRDETNSYTGELRDFLKTRNAEDYTYDVVVFDFCGSWSAKHKEAVELLFKKKLIDTVGVFAITLSYRNGKKSLDYMHQNVIEGKNDIRRIAYENGYDLGWFVRLQNKSDQVCSYIWKCIERKDAMHYQKGIQYDKSGFAADHWCDTPVKE